MIFCSGAPDPEKATLSPGRVGGFCRAQRVPSFDERSLTKFEAVSEILGLKRLHFSPHGVIPDELSAPQQCRVVGVVAGYNCQKFCDPSLHTARVGGHRNFRRFGPCRTCIDDSDSV